MSEAAQPPPLDVDAGEFVARLRNPPMMEVIVVVDSLPIVPRAGDAWCALEFIEEPPDRAAILAVMFEPLRDPLGETPESTTADKFFSVYEEDTNPLRWARLRQFAPCPRAAVQQALDALELPLAILNFSSGDDPWGDKKKRLPTVIRHESGLIEPLVRADAFALEIAEMDDPAIPYWRWLCETPLHEPLTRIEKRVFQAIRIWNKAHDEGSRHVQYVLLFAALETLLDLEPERMTDRLGERVAYLASPGPGLSRQALYQEVKNLYDVRSKIVHRADGALNDIWRLDRIVRHTIWRVIELYIDAYDEKWRRSDTSAQWLDRWFQSRRFGID